MSFMITMTREEVRSLRALLENAPTNERDLDALYKKVNEALEDSRSIESTIPEEDLG